MQLLEILRTRAGQRNQTALESLQAAANRAAADETVDHTAVEKALDELRMTVDDFDAMCSLARNRRQWKAAMDRGAAAEKKLAALGETVERERGQFEKIRAAWMARATELDAEIDVARRTAGAARDAREQLVRPENLAEPWRTRVADALAALQEAENSIGPLEREMREQRERLKSHTEAAEHHKNMNTMGHFGDWQDYERHAKRAERRLAELVPEHVEAVAARDAASKELAAAQESAARS